MGIDFTCLDAICMAQEFCMSKKSCLQLGRQQLHVNPKYCDYIFKKYSVPNMRQHPWCGYCEELFKDLGYDVTDSMDNSDYENASIIHNLNKPIPPSINKYDFIFDGGTTEHVFNTLQVCKNVINMLNISGIYCSVTCNNNFSGHGAYQFSPEFFLSIFNEKYGMKIHRIFLAVRDTESKVWIDVNDFNLKNGGRNCAKFDTQNEVYIITIAEKISDQGLDLFEDPPNQYSYENITWKTS